MLLATEVREVRARNVEQDIKILQLFDLILQLHAEVGRRRAPVVEGEAEAEDGARSVSGLGVTVYDYVEHPAGADGIDDEGDVHSAGQDGPAGLDDTDDEGNVHSAGQGGPGMMSQSPDHSEQHLPCKLIVVGVATGLQQHPAEPSVGEPLEPAESDGLPMLLTCAGADNSDPPAFF